MIEIEQKVKGLRKKDRKRNERRTIERSRKKEKTLELEIKK